MILFEEDVNSLINIHIHAYHNNFKLPIFKDYGAFNNISEN